MVETQETPVPDINPYTYPIEFVDDKGNALSALSFQVSVDQGSPEDKETDERGTMKVQKPQSEINLKLKGSISPQ